MPIDYLALAKEAVLASTVLNAGHKYMNKVSPERMARFWNRAESWVPGHLDRTRNTLINHAGPPSAPVVTKYGPTEPASYGKLTARKPVTPAVAKTNLQNMGTDLLQRATDMRPEQMHGVSMTLDANPTVASFAKFDPKTNHVYGTTSPITVAHELGHAMAGQGDTRNGRMIRTLTEVTRKPNRTRAQGQVIDAAVAHSGEAPANLYGARLARNAGIPNYLNTIKNTGNDTYVAALLNNMLSARHTDPLGDLGLQGKFRRIVPSIQPKPPRQRKTDVFSPGSYLLSKLKTLKAQAEPVMAARQQAYKEHVASGAPADVAKNIHMTESARITPGRPLLMRLPKPPLSKQLLPQKKKK